MLRPLLLAATDALPDIRLASDMTELARDLALLAVLVGGGAGGGTPLMLGGAEGGTGAGWMAEESAETTDSASCNWLSSIADGAAEAALYKFALKSACVGSANRPSLEMPSGKIEGPK